MFSKKVLCNFIKTIVTVTSLLLTFPLICHGSPGTIDLEISKKSSKISRYLTQNDRKKIADNKYIIKEVIILGNKSVKKAILLNSIIYKKGIVFDSAKSNSVINNLYKLGHFRQIQLEIEIIDDKHITLYIIVEEKKILDSLEIKGNKAVSTKKINENFNLDKLTSVDEETLRQITLSIKKLYKEENRHFVEIDAKLIQNKQNTDKASAVISIKEGPKSVITRVNFKGNKYILDRKLRKAIFTRENWLLSFTDGAGTYDNDKLEMDKHYIEYFYRDKGYLTAKVIKTEIIFSEDKKDISVTFHIKEGNQFIVHSLHAPGDEIFLEKELLPLIALEKGTPYSQSKLISSINNLRNLWGEKGYIYADVYPQVKPNEKTNQVDISFNVERGNKLYTNRINITGNTITRDKVIRRQLDIIEGDLITTRKLQQPKNSVEYLSFFNRDGVEWKIHRLSDDLADLEMNVKEAKTGQLSFKLTYGSDKDNPKRSIRGMINIEKRNLFGRGWDAGGMIEASRHRIKKIEGHFFDPHLFDSDVSGALSIYKRWEEYDQWRNVKPSPIQKVFGGNVRLGLGLPKIDKHLQLIFDLGIEDIKNNKPHAINEYKEAFEPIVRRSFQEGTLKWLGIDLIKDTRNHKIYPNKGYKLTLSTKTAPSGINKEFGFFKVEAHGSNYNSLIGVDTLVLAMQLKLSHVSTLGDKIIPYKELFHMGGQTTVRGHIWGGIGPAWKTGDPLGAKNAVQFNTELIFPLIEDYSMKGHVFYDAGAGWNTPRNNIKNPEFIQRNKFDLRHSVGFGLNLMNPIPAKIDWGFKLDRKRHRKESAHEFHLTMNYAW